MVQRIYIKHFIFIDIDTDNILDNILFEILTLHLSILLGDAKFAITRATKLQKLYLYCFFNLREFPTFSDILDIQKLEGNFCR